VAEVHLVTGIALLAANLVAGIWGGFAWLTQRPALGFWYALRVAQAAVVIEALLGLALVFTGREGSDLHYLYGGLPLLISLLAEGARASSAQLELGELDFRSLPEERQQAIAIAIFRRETGIMAVSCLVIFGLALRAAGTSAAF
jgi:hypothetical protein